jgi:protein-disulfide isomerase
MHKLIIEMSYGSAENFNKIYDAVMTDEYVEGINEQVETQLENMGAGSESTSEGTAGELVNPTAEEWNGNSDEAYKLFGLSGTPGNAVINTKNRMYKAVGGAYPKESFEEAIAAVKAETAQTDDMGNAGYLTETQLAKLLDGVYYRNNKANADIVIVEYSDLICPYCQRHYDNKTLESIVDTEDSVALAFKNMPLDFHPTADLGAK